MRRTLAGLLLGTTALLAGAPAAGAETETDPAPAIERIELHCRKAVVAVEVDGEVHRKLVIGCRWTGSESEAFAGYRLVRKVDTAPRMVVFRTDNRDRHRFIDRRVRRDHEYTYRLVVVDADGHVIGLSNKAVVTT